MKKIWLIAWLVFTCSLTSYFAYALFYSPDKSLFIVGEATHGHHQIELACTSCHTSAFGGPEVLQEACLNCHQAELTLADDSHPIKKFTDPRNADRLAKLNATECVTCHREHQNEQTHAMGVTLPEDFCFECHQEIANERPSHQGMGFDTCASAGCHNYHDNKALYEDFLVKHGHSQEPLSAINIKLTNAVSRYKNQHPDISPLNISEANYPAATTDEITDIAQHWAASAHAEVGVNCHGCHLGENNQWLEIPAITSCNDCHQQEWQQFTESHHGMRQSAKLSGSLSPMSPALARLPFKAEASDKALNCQSCHDPHQLDLNYAATEACLSCHNDEHSLAFKASKHFDKSLRSVNAALNPELANVDVTCATCHLPIVKLDGEMQVMHNPNHTLRPNEKMIRSACLDCHSLAFSIDALADKALIKSNFNGRPARQIDSINMALERITEEN